jgi:rhodanese-related sulfurtransferase
VAHEYNFVHRKGQSGGESGEESGEISLQVQIQLLFYNARIDLNHWIPVKFILDHIFIVSIVVLSGGALLWPLLTARGKKASPLEVTQLINRSKTTIVDVSTEAEFANGHLRDAKNIPLKDLATRMGELDKFKGKPLVVVCQTGSRSGAAAAKLAANGFDGAVSLDGGIAAWTTAGLPLVK